MSKMAICKECGKERRHEAKGLCATCYRRQCKPKIIVCKVCGKKSPHQAKDLCMVCYNHQYYKENSEKILEQKRGYYQENRGAIIKRLYQYREEHYEKVREQDRQSRWQHREERRETNRLWRKANVDYIRECGHRYYEANRNRIDDYNRRWYKANLEKARALGRKRAHCYRARKNNVILGEVDEALVYNLYDHRCFYCGSADNLTIDHIIPLNGGGAHCQDNLVPACSKCNSSKRDKSLLEWLRSQPYSLAWLF